MERRFSQLRWKDRLRIEKMMKEGRKIREIAEALHVHNSTIYREIKRGNDVAAGGLGICRDLLPGDRRAQVSGEHAGKGGRG